MFGVFDKYYKYYLSFGTEHDTKTDEFSEKFQTAFDPPPSFSESNIANFLNWLRSLQKLPEPYIFEKLWVLEHQ